MLLQQRWEQLCAKDVPSLPVLGAMSCVSPVLCWTIPKKRWEGAGDRAGNTPEREGDMGQRSGLSCSCRESSESSWIPGASRVRDPASPGLISHPPAQGRFHILQPIPAIFPKAAASAGTQLLQLLADVWQLPARGSLSGAARGAPGAEPGSCRAPRAPRAGPSPAHGGGARIPGSKHSALF